MKRLLILLTLTSMVFGFMAFQCSSTEMTSAKLYIQQKNYAKAKESLEKEITKNPQSDEGYYYLGYINGEQGDMPSMLENFQKSLEISNKFQKNIDDYKKYQWAENFNKGVGFFNKASKVEDTDSTDMFLDKAIEHFNFAIACQPDSADTYKNLIFAYKSLGDYDKTLGEYEKVLDLEYSDEIAEEYSETLLYLGNESTKEYESSKDPQDSIKAYGYWNKAIGILETRVEKDPNNTTMLENLYKLYRLTKGYDATLEKVEQKIAKNPDNKVSHYVKGILLLGKNKYEDAAKSFQDALNIDPNYEDAIYNLGITYFNWGAKLFNESLEAENPTEEYKEKFQSAQPLFETYVELNPEDAGGWENLAKIYTQLGDTEKATEAFNKADSLRQQL